MERTMRVRVKVDDTTFPIKVSMTIFDAPHRRMDKASLKVYRKTVRKAFIDSGYVMLPIADPVDLTVVFINPTSADLGNSYLALEQAMDSVRGTKDGILMDDKLISRVDMMKLTV